MARSISLLVLICLFNIQVKATTDTTKIDTWQDAIQVLFVNPRGESLEPSEALRLLQVARGRKVGPFEVNSLLEFNEQINGVHCTGERFHQLDMAFELSHEKAPTLDGYLRDCLKKQVDACKFELNFKRVLAKLDSDAMADIERLADLLKSDNAKLQPIEKNVGKNYNSQAVVEALRDLVNRYAGDRQASGQEEKVKILEETMNKLIKQLQVFRNKLQHNLMGLLRDPSMLEDRTIARYYKVLQIFLAIKKEEDLVDRVKPLL